MSRADHDCPRSVSAAPSPPEAGERLASTPLHIPVLAETATAAVLLEADKQATRQCHFLALVDHRRPPLDRDTVSVDERTPHAHARVVLLSVASTPVGAYGLAAAERVAERGSSDSSHLSVKSETTSSWHERSHTSLSETAIQSPSPRPSAPRS
jgi:hypothetical protein